MLRDPRPRLRLFAASKAASSRLRELLPALEAAIAREAPGELRDAMAWNRDLLRDGRAVIVHCDGRLWVSWRWKGGAASALLTAGRPAAAGR